MSSLAEDLNSPNSTPRLIQLLLARIEAETRNRLSTESEPDKLEGTLREETDKYLTLQQIIEEDARDSVSKQAKMLNHSRDASFYKEKNAKLSSNDDDNLKQLAIEVLAKRNELKRLQKSLDEFRNLKPTNEALKEKIEELKKSRLSLEMTFVDEL